MRNKEFVFTYLVVQYVSIYIYIIGIVIIILILNILISILIILVTISIIVISIKKYNKFMVVYNRFQMFHLFSENKKFASAILGPPWPVACQRQ